MKNKGSFCLNEASERKNKGSFSLNEVSEKKQTKVRFVSMFFWGKKKKVCFV